jgi:tRNA dimethylallyltransferase
MIRALEVYRKTGQPISALQCQFALGRTAQECRVFVLAWDRAVLYRRIEERVDQMFADGLVDEVRRLLQDPRPLSRTAQQAVGYREVLAHLAGHSSLPEAVELVKRHTRQLAKRQMTWFRSLSECRFLPVAEPFDAAALAEQIIIAP